jgi:hypothetical protein
VYCEPLMRHGTARAVAKLAPSCSLAGGMPANLAIGILNCHPAVSKRGR